MIRSFYTSSVGMKQNQHKFEVIANNVSNISTVGYKPSRAEFSELLYTNLKETDDLQAGNGMKLQKTDASHSAGSYITTNRTLDFAIMSNEGYFGILTDEGVKYTRAGNFSLSQGLDGNFYLALPGAGYVLGPDGNPVAVSSEQDNVNIGVFSFANRDGLLKDGNNLFVATENSGQAFSIDNSCVKNNTLEGSAVDLATEMSELILAQRNFQFNSRMVQMSDEIMQTINNLR
ncbi:MAG TPA: flagellar hook-basal body protein [Clostridiales bacterium]|nr:flagellar hook-basal body protein [Clostridiales bacterium]